MKIIEEENLNENFYLNYSNSKLDDPSSTTKSKKKMKISNRGIAIFSN